jgi:RNA polymerase sigma-70 factor, ECF subfamily
MPREDTDTPGREAFFARAVAEHARLLYRVAFSLLRHAEDAEDAVQDALLKLHRTGAWQGVADERAYLIRTVWHAAADRLATRKRLPVALGRPDDNDLDLLALAPDPRPSPEQALADCTESVLLNRWIDELPPELRDPLLLASVEGLTSREAAEALGLTDNLVRSRLHRARRELRNRWERLQRRRASSANLTTPHPAPQPSAAPPRTPQG